jgi:hypothetical protein
MFVFILSFIYISFILTNLLFICFFNINNLLHNFISCNLLYTYFEHLFVISLSFLDYLLIFLMYLKIKLY